MPKRLQRMQRLKWLKFLRHSAVLPTWVQAYDRRHLTQDLLAGVIVGILVIPQSLGYAMLAGLPPVYGLYSAIVPVVVYAWLGASTVNAVGPVAITAIMTAQALHDYQHLPPHQYALMASLLALLTGLLLGFASLLRLSWITQFISRGVTAGFISGASLLIFIGQIKYITGITISGNTLIANANSFMQQLATLHLPTLFIGSCALLMLLFNRYLLKSSLLYIFPLLSGRAIDFTVRLMPLLILIVSIFISRWWQFDQMGIRTIQDVPNGLPHWVLPFYPLELSQLIELLPAAGLMALIAFVSSHAVASAYARARNESFSAQDELKGLGLANIAGAFFQSFPVVGGFSRTAVNAEAGAKTPLASIVAVLVMSIVLLFFNRLLAPLPYAILGATIMSAIIGMVDFKTFKQALRYDHIDAVAYLAALFGVLLFGVNNGLVLGILLSFAGLIWQSSHPHIAIVGQIGRNGHFRNKQRHQVQLQPHVVIIRIDESLFFGNVHAVQDFIESAVQEQVAVKDVILMFSAVNHVDLTAQDMLLTLNQLLAKDHIILHLAEVKGPVMDVLRSSALIEQLSGQVFLSTQDAITHIQATS